MGKRKNYKRFKHIKSKYGTEAVKLFELDCKKQKNKCAICEEKRILVLDHDHLTNRYRG